MQRFIVSLALVTLITATGLAQSKPDQIVPIWPDAPPAWVAPDLPERDTTGADGRTVAGRRVTRLGNVSTPQLHIYQPKSKSSDTAVLICPGGGYNILAWDLEGTEIAEWLRGLGMTAIVVKYRVPSRKSDPIWLAPVQDIQRGLSLVRSGAIEGVTPKRIGLLGFSAGGNAVARTATASKRHYEPVDDTDQSDASPDFSVLVYPAWLVERDNSHQLIEEIQVTDQTPPMFFAHAFDDRVSCMSSVTLFSELQKRGIASSLHVFASGGHGFGGRDAGSPTDAWKGLCETWMREQGFAD